MFVHFYIFFDDDAAVKKPGSNVLILCPKCSKTHLRASLIPKKFIGVPQWKGRGGKGKKKKGSGEKGGEGKGCVMAVGGMDASDRLTSDRQTDRWYTDGVWRLGRDHLLQRAHWQRLLQHEHADRYVERQILNIHTHSLRNSSSITQDFPVNFGLKTVVNV